MMRVQPIGPWHRLFAGRPARRFALALYLSLTTLTAGVAFSQHSGDAGSAPPPPAGPGRITVQLVADAGTDASAASIEGISIALYALSPDGSPGMTSAKTDAAGQVIFPGISNDPGIVYLVGARYAEIPFGERVTFGADTTEAHVDIHVSPPTDQVSGVHLDEIRARVDWMGDRIVVTESLRITSAGPRVIQLDRGDRSQAITRRPLPPEARDFSAGQKSIGDGLALEDGNVRYWGPLYPGEQQIEYHYSLPLASEPSAPKVPKGAAASAKARTLVLPIELREAVDRIVIIAGTPGIEVAGPGLVASREVKSDSGEPLESWARGALAAGQKIEVTLELPESRLDPSALSIPRADVWLDLDDTRLNASVTLQFQVEPGPPVSGTPDAPLMHVSIPDGGALEGVSPETESMGLIPTDNGFNVIGPIGPGEHSLGYSYRLPSDPDGVTLDMRFPRNVATLNVLVADSGVALDSSRLHRRRPFRNGTRNYLHREAFNIDRNEVVDLELAPLQGEGIPPEASIALTVAGAALGALFLAAPLRRRARHEEAAKSEDPELVRIRDEREAVYSAIGDLDHDFETGKLDAADHGEMRDELRNQAIELLRREQTRGAALNLAADPSAPASVTTGSVIPTGAAAPTSSPASPAGRPAPPSPGPAPTKAVTAATAPANRSAPVATLTQSSPTQTGQFCPSCGGRIDARWRFCSHCGGELSPATSEGGTGASAEETTG